MNGNGWWGLVERARDAAGDRADESLNTPGAEHLPRPAALFAD